MLYWVSLVSHHWCQCPAGVIRVRQGSSPVIRNQFIVGITMFVFKLWTKFHVLDTFGEKHLNPSSYNLKSLWHVNKFLRNLKNVLYTIFILTYVSYAFYYEFKSKHMGVVHTQAEYSLKKCCKRVTYTWLNAHIKFV